MHTPNTGALSHASAAAGAGVDITEAELRPDVDEDTGIDLSLLRENLKLTPWEHLLANEDTINFIDMAREAMRRKDGTS